MLQKKAIRAINSAGYNAHTEPLFKLYNLLKVEDIYKFRLLVFYHNLCNCDPFKAKSCSLCVKEGTTTHKSNRMRTVY